MQIRWKLLLILMSLTIIPMLTLSFITRTKSHDLVHKMTESSREILIKRAKTELLRRMEDHSEIVSRERQIVTLALRTQSGRLRQIIEGREKRIRPVKTKELVNSPKHVIQQKDGSYEPLKVDFSKVRLDLSKDATISQAEAVKLFQPMIRPFRKLEKSNPDLIYWQIIRLDNGAIATYPYYEPENPNTTHAHWMDPATHKHLKTPPPPQHPPMHLNGMQKREIPPHDWFNAARFTQKNPFWMPPYKDPITGKFIVAAVSKIQEFQGKFHGAVMVMVPLGNVLSNDLDVTGLSENTASLLVRKRPSSTDGTRLQIIAEERQGISTSKDHGGWMAGKNTKWLSNSNTQVYNIMLKDIENETSGYVQMDYKGKDSLWFYAPIKLSQTALILVVPMENIISTTIQSENYVKTEIESQFKIITIFIWVLTAIILIMSLVLSKTMTQRISDIAMAFNQLAEGDFSARSTVRGKDELANLSNTFNELAPALEEQVRLKEALTVAQEVQRSLLPQSPPQVDGLDVAGMSMYCEDTGGDYFDYPHLGIEADELGLAVGDVSGHGVPAALLMTTARALLRQRAERGGNLGMVVADANRMLSEDVRLSGRFMTLFMFAIDLESHTARWVRAGHDPALVYLPSEDSFSELGGDTGLPLGVDGDWEYIEEHAHLEDGSVILIGTDGIWEAVNINGKMYGKERLNDILQKHHSNSAQEILDTIILSLKDFTGDAGFEDDVTLAVVKIL